MYDTILVPLDGSRRAEAILPHVEGVARSMGAKVLLLTAVEHRIFVDADGIRSQMDEGDFERRSKEAKTYLENLETGIRAKDIQVESRVDFGPAVESIIKVADEAQASLIAIASHGRSGLGRVFYGSIAAGLLQTIDRPLLLIRSRAH